MDLTGQTFGMLTVLREVVSSHKSVRKWLCQCNCGKESEVYQSALRQGKTTSCGCKVGVVAKATHTTHGDSGERLHTIWKGMKGRCASNHPDYGGRGISVCQEWAESYESFRDWSLANGYSDDLSIDRFPDTNGNYEPANCRWATDEEQANNKRRRKNCSSNNKGVTFDKATNKWRAYKRANNKYICLGRYVTEEEANKALGV